MTLARERCRECRGHGWNVGECHPREECGWCWGKGIEPHEFKTWPELFAHVWSGAKPFEMRKDDRGIQPGDVVRLREWTPATQSYSGRVVRATVGYVLRTSSVVPVPPGFCIFGLVDRENHTTRPPLPIAACGHEAPCHFPACETVQR
jgi:hypothetical protein